ncbi:MAG: LacI family DNA-binding transcriptional regulator [Alphaproteobacteria bacterium]
MKSTISDVAKLAGVSIKTVSRVLNGEPNVAEKTRVKVQAAAKDLNYSPSLAARGLAGSKSYLIALLYDIPSPGFIATIQKGATQACREAGYHLIVEPIDMTNPDSLAGIETTLRRLPVDGVILLPPVCDSSKIVSQIKALRIPYVPVAPSMPHDDVRNIRMDDFKAAYEMTEYLIGLGHKDIGFIKGPEAHGASALRYDGFTAAMNGAGLSVNQAYITEGAFTYTSGVAAGETLFSLPKLPTAIFASNDDMATGVVSAANKKGIKIPEDISLCGFDDTPLATIITPHLTTIQQPIRTMGYQAAKLLVQKKEDEDTPETGLLEHKLIVRDSTQKPR